MCGEKCTPDHGISEYSFKNWWTFILLSTEDSYDVVYIIMLTIEDGYNTLSNLEIRRDVTRGRFHASLRVTLKRAFCHNSKYYAHVLW